MSSYCTAVGLVSKDEVALYGRTMEYGNNLSSSILFYPRHTLFQGSAFHKIGKQWISLFSILGFNQIAMSHYKKWIVDGINEYGLVVGALSLPHFTQYQPFDKLKHNETIGCWELVTYLLGTCRCLHDVRNHLSTIIVADQPLLYDTSISVIQPAFHYMAMDRSGECMVIEYIKGQLYIYDNEQKVLTNAPPFPDQLKKWKQFKKQHPTLTAYELPNLDRKRNIGSNIWSIGTGMIGLPGDFTSSSRFQRVMEFLHWMYTPLNAEEGVKSLFHLLETVDIPKGTIRERGGNRSTDTYTQWTVVYDTDRLRLYVRTYDGMELIHLDMNSEWNTPRVWRLNKTTGSLHSHDITSHGRFVS
jgi:choloylglycine hydrolase